MNPCYFCKYLRNTKQWTQCIFTLFERKIAASVPSHKLQKMFCIIWYYVLHAVLCEKLPLVDDGTINAQLENVNTT